MQDQHPEVPAIGTAPAEVIAPAASETLGAPPTLEPLTMPAVPVAEVAPALGPNPAGPEAALSGFSKDINGNDVTENALAEASGIPAVPAPSKLSSPINSLAPIGEPSSATLNQATTVRAEQKAAEAAKPASKGLLHKGLVLFGLRSPEPVTSKISNEGHAPGLIPGTNQTQEMPHVTDEAHAAAQVDGKPKFDTSAIPESAPQTAEPAVAPPPVETPAVIAAEKADDTESATPPPPPVEIPAGPVIPPLVVPGEGETEAVAPEHVTATTDDAADVAGEHEVADTIAAAPEQTVITAQETTTDDFVPSLPGEAPIAVADAPAASADIVPIRPGVEPTVPDNIRPFPGVTREEIVPNGPIESGPVEEEMDKPANSGDGTPPPAAPAAAA